MAEQWYYTHGAGQERIGPVGKDELKAAIAGGQVGPQALVWRVGMPQWAAASSVPGLVANPEISAAKSVSVANPVGAAVAFEAAVAPIAAAFAPQASPRIDYYSGPGGLPPRAAATLAGHARPTGDTNTWPLDDMLVAQWEHALKLRKKISSAAQLFRGLFALSLIGAVPLGIFMLVSLMSNSSRTRSEGMAMIFPEVLIAGFCVLYVFLWRATMRSKRWAPLTFFIVCLVGILANAAGMALAVANTSNSSVSVGATAPAVAGGLVGMILPAVFAVVAWKAYAAIPSYLMQPAWCQELLVKSKL